MSRTTLALLACSVLWSTGQARGAEPFTLQWKLATPGVWPPATIAGKLLLKSGETISAHDLSSGRLLWTRRIPNLRHGEHALATSDQHIFVLSSEGLHRLRPEDGQETAKRRLPGPDSVFFTSGSLYLSGKEGLLRLDGSGEKILQRTGGFAGELLGADGDYVALFIQRSEGDPKLSPKRLAVINLRTGKRVYEFKLLRSGSHQLLQVQGGRLVFIDYSQRDGRGGNPRKLYYTEADYVKGKKLKDISLSAKYTAETSDSFSITTGAAGVVFFGNHGVNGEGSTLFAFDPGKDKTLWTRSGTLTSMGIVLHQGALWTAVTDGQGTTRAAAYSPEDGNATFHHPLDGGGVGAPVSVGERLLLRTRDSIYCFGSRPTEAPAAPPVPAAKPDPGQAPGVTRPGWRLFRDKVVGYFLQTPTSWTFNRAGLRQLGGVRMVTPFVRTSPGAAGGAPVMTGSLHVLTWEAAGRDVDGLWRSVYSQRRRLDPEVRVVKVKRFPEVGGSGQPGILATYSFRNRAGYSVQLRSLCVVSHGVAFELRGWAGPQQPEAIWREVDEIIATFRPHRF